MESIPVRLIGWILPVLTLLLPLPHGRKVDLALGTAERLRGDRALLVLGQVVDHVLQAQHVHELGVAGVRDKVHLWWWGFRGRDLEEIKVNLSLKR